MPFYDFACGCGEKIEVFRPMKDCGKPQVCLCGKKMERDYQRMNIHAANKDYSKPIISDSLAINVSQIDEHKKLFPDVRITNEGQPILENYKQHDKYLKKIGFVKQPKKVKTKGKRIA